MTEKRTWVGPSAPERLNILRNTRTIAIVGMSDKISRASNFVATYLLSSSPYTATKTAGRLPQTSWQPTCCLPRRIRWIL